MGTHQPPRILKRWTVDAPNGELYELIILADGRVCSAYGRFALRSGSSYCTWSEFLGGAMNALVTKAMGETVLEEARMFITNYRVS
jgi:hypothetical protein